MPRMPSPSCIVYTAADIRRDESDEQVTEFLSYWKKINRGLLPTFVFDSRFTSYEHLSELNSQGVKFITLRRRGSKLLKSVDTLRAVEENFHPPRQTQISQPAGAPVHDCHEGLRRGAAPGGNPRTTVMRSPPF